MMNAITTAEPRRSVLVDMAASYGMEATAFEATLRGTVFPGTGTREQFAAFLVVAKQYGLNPFTKEIYAFPAKGGGIVPVVSIDGWLKLINSQPNYDNCEFVDQHTEKGGLISVTCSIWRKDRTRPTKITEYRSECYRATDPWKMEHRMLRHKALIQCARYAFGFAGIYDEDEAERITAIAPQVAQVDTPPTPPRPPPRAAISAPKEETAIASDPVKRDPPPHIKHDFPAPVERSPAPSPEPDAVQYAGPTVDEHLAGLNEDLAVAKTVDDIEAIYAESDIEATFSAIAANDAGAVANARKIKADHIARIATTARADRKPLTETSDTPVEGWNTGDEAYEREFNRRYNAIGDKESAELALKWWRSTTDVRKELCGLGQRQKMQTALQQNVARFGLGG